MGNTLYFIDRFPCVRIARSDVPVHHPGGFPAHDPLERLRRHIFMDRQDRCCCMAAGVWRQVAFDIIS